MFDFVDTAKEITATRLQCRLKVKVKVFLSHLSVQVLPGFKLLGSSVSTWLMAVTTQFNVISQIHVTNLPAPEDLNG